MQYFLLIKKCWSFYSELLIYYIFKITLSERIVWDENTQVPPDIATLQSLRVLALEGNPLLTIPSGSVDLPKLQSLSVNKVMSTPAAELRGDNLTSFKNLDLEVQAWR
jgi:Leucine-rich repeat (LRR) protein